MEVLNKRTCIRAMALALCLCVCFGLAPATALAVDLDAPCTVKVRPGSEDADFLADVKEANIVVDLYRVADVTAAEGYDSYDFSLTDDYAALSFAETMDADAWKTMAQDAAAIAKEKGGAVVEGEAVETGITVTPGLYLLIARGADLDEYWGESEPEDDGTARELYTVARSHHYDYHFLPQLFAVPSKEADESGVINTANPGEWQYELNITLKASRERRTGELKIVKTLSERTGPDPAMFVFHWYAYDADDALLRDDVATISFTAGGEKSVVIDQLPDGAKVVVHEEENSHYTLVTPNDAEAVISAEEIAQVSFTNQPNDNPGGGFGISNHFEYGVYDETTGEFQSSGWDWTPQTDSH